MPRNTRGGNKAKRGKNRVNNFNNGPPLYKDNSPNSSELYAKVLKREGGDPPRVIAYCENGVERNCRIPGKFKRRVFMNPGDIIIITYDKSKSDKKGEIKHKYSQQDVDTLKKEGIINDNTFTKPEDFQYNDNVTFEEETKTNNNNFYDNINSRINSIQNLDKNNLDYLDDDDSDSDIDFDKL